MREISNVRRFLLPTALFTLLLTTLVCRAADDDDQKPASSATAPSGGDRYGMFGLLDKRSRYNTDWFPEPFRVEDTTINNEVRFDWSHSEGKGLTSNLFSAEIQKSFGLATFEIRGSYLRSAASHLDGTEIDSTREEGLGNVELGARWPIWQFVSASELVDNTVGINLELGIPVNSRASKNAEIGPGIFDDLRIGEHFSLQSLFTFSSLLGSRPEESREAFEYGLAFGYAIEDEEFPVPYVERTIPIFEIVGETSLEGDRRGHNSLTGTAGLRFELKPIDRIQPQFGVGYIFPMDQGGREELRWGIITSLTLEF
jgi:hypothetical protein